MSPHGYPNGHMLKVTFKLITWKAPSVSCMISGWVDIRVFKRPLASSSVACLSFVSRTFADVPGLALGCEYVKLFCRRPAIMAQHDRNAPSWQLWWQQRRRMHVSGSCSIKYCDRHFKFELQFRYESGCCSIHKLPHCRWLRNWFIQDIFFKNFFDAVQPRLK